MAVVTGSANDNESGRVIESDLTKAKATRRTHWVDRAEGEELKRRAELLVL